MKPNLLLIAALGALSGAAHAQSSLTLFGVVDVNARYVKNATVHETQVGSDGLSSSRIGFRGLEEISDTLKAGFHLESSIVPDTGNINASGKFWHRRATVSLISSDFGELRLGRDTVPTWLAYVDGDPYSTTGIGDSSKTYAALGGADTRLRSDNLVAYFLPSNAYGIYGTIASAPGEGVAGRRYAGARLGYRAGPADLSVAYGETSVTLGTYKLAIVSGSYDMGFAKVYALAQKSQLLDLANVHASIGLAVPVPYIGGTLRASYTHADGQGFDAAGVSNEANDADQYVLGYIFDFSKRTALYSTVSVIENKGAANNIVQKIPTFDQPAGQRSQGVEAGIRHSF